MSDQVNKYREQGGVAENPIAEVFEEAVVDAEVKAEQRLRPTTETTAAEMERARPDLLTGELKLPKG